jgi:apolipoprotein N-acyltransferase
MWAWYPCCSCCAPPREGLWAGVAAGAGFFAALYHWLLPYAGVFVLLFAPLLRLLWAPWGWLVGRLLHGTLQFRHLVAALTVLPSVWVLAEYARSWDRLADPWGLLGVSQWNARPVLALAALGGVWALSLLLVMVNGRSRPRSFPALHSRSGWRRSGRPR